MGCRSLRRRDRQLPHELAVDLLKRAMVGHLGLAHRDIPYVVPICFVYAEGRIYFHSAAEGMKLEFLKVNPRACLVVEEYGGPRSAPEPCNIGINYRSAIAFGRVEEVSEQGEILEALNLLVRKYMPAWDHKVTPGHLAAEANRELKVFALVPELMTGKGSY